MNRQHSLATTGPGCRNPRPRAALMGAVLLAILLAAGLRFHRLDAQSLWNDEGASVAMAHRPLAEILPNAAADIHPPGYYALLAGWVRLAGDSEFALRALSALQSVLTVALACALGRRLFGRGAGLAAALLLAVNTFAIYYAQEARMYAQLGLLATAGMWALALWLARAGRGSTGVRPLLALTLINAAGLYTHYAYPLTMLAQGVLFLGWWARRRDLRALGLYAAANAITLLLFAPWAGHAIRQVTTWPNVGAGAGAEAVLRVLAFGLTAQDGVGWTGALGALALAGGLALYRRRALLPPLWAGILAGSFLLLGLRADDLKQLLPAATAAALWLGAGAVALWRAAGLLPRALAILGSASLAVTLVGGLPPLYNDLAYARDDYRAMAARVLAQARPEDAVILNGPGQGEVWAYYYRGAAPVYPLPRGLGGDDAATRAEVERILADHRRVFVLYWGEGERDPNRVVEATLTAQAFQVDSRWYGDVRFVLYAAQGQAATAPTDILDVRFGGHITLHGFALDRTAHRPGEVLTLTLFWRTDAPLQARYKVFVHLYADPDAPPPAQHDSEPGGGLAPTVSWTPGQTIIDRHGVLLPPTLPPGDYTLAVGLYRADDPGARLPTAQGERLPLATVRVAGGP